MATKDGPRLLTREEVHAKRTAVLECLKKTEEHKFTQRMVQHFKDEKQPLPEPVPVTPEPMKPMSKRTWEKEFYNYKCAVRFYAQLHDKMFQFESELGEASARDRRLAAELGASEESQVRLRQELSAERVEAAEADERLEAEIEAALSEAEAFEAAAQRRREERGEVEEEEKEQRAEAAARRARLKKMEGAHAPVAGPSAAAARQSPPTQPRPGQAKEEPPRPELPALSSTLRRPEEAPRRSDPEKWQEEEPPPAEAVAQHQEADSQPGLEEAPADAIEEDGYTKEEWMEFFIEEGLPSDQLAVLEQIFSKLDTSGDGVLSADELSTALNDRSLKMSEETRQALVDFMYDVA
ncbi:unnamed protein product [Symbiodinium natans]|uniref:EF-hand domain-containing protein n=1 Tax=Symbiodinium natans TaxID=878477 RepID=A0A812Q2C4_9DINO|nr:unnamed protein product [Symbiodinium natans]